MNSQSGIQPIANHNNLRRGTRKCGLPAKASFVLQSERRTANWPDWKKRAAQSNYCFSNEISV